MDPGSRSGEVAPSPASAAPATSRTLWTRASLVWMLIVLAETGSGWVREVFIAPQIGALRARQLGVLVGSVMILLITWACARWMNLRNERAAWQVGAFWVALIVVFELAVGRAMGASWDRLISDYNPLRGGLMLLGLAVLFMAPWLTRPRK